jgi:hypothetical protein
MKKAYLKPTMTALGLLRDITKQSLSKCHDDCVEYY